MTKSILFALYIGFLLALIFPKGAIPLSQVSLFAVFFALSYLLLKQSGAIKQKKNETGLQMILLILDIGLAISSLVYFLGRSIVAKIPSPFEEVFVSKWALLGWLILPLLALAIFRGKKEKSGRH